MTIPTWADILLPLLELVKDGEEYRMITLKQSLANYFHLTEEEIDKRLQGGTKIFYNRVDWAKNSLKEAGLIESPKKAHMKITNKGQIILSQTPSISKSDIIKMINEERKRIIEEETELEGEDIYEAVTEEEPTPSESLEIAYDLLKKEVMNNIYEYIRSKSADSDFFEGLVLELLFKIGYGTGKEKLGGRHPDGGIDGIIYRDKLGLNKIYIQAKNTEHNMDINDVKAVASLLLEKPHTNAIFIITARFTKPSREYELSLEGRLKLIDGQQLVELMFENNIGVRSIKNLEIKEFDESYLSEFLSL